MSQLRFEMPFGEYLENPGYGSSDLRSMRFGPPAMVKWRRENRDHEDSDAMKLGTACHCAILTPELFSGVFALKPKDMSFVTKEGKAWRDAQGSKSILTYEESQTVLAVKNAFCGKQTAYDSLERAKGKEVSVFWTCMESGLRCKGRPDWYDDEAVYDLKISRHAINGMSLPYRSYMEGWMHQLAHNRAGLIENGVNVLRGRLVVISPKEPHGINIWTLEVKPDSLDMLEFENIETRKAIAACERSGVWPGTPDEWKLIEPPVSALQDIGNLEGAIDG